MAQDDFDPKLGRIRDTRRTRAERHAALVFRQAGKHGARALRLKGHVAPANLKPLPLAQFQPTNNVAGFASADGRVLIELSMARSPGSDVGPRTLTQVRPSVAP